MTSTDVPVQTPVPIDQMSVDEVRKQYRAARERRLGASLAAAQQTTPDEAAQAETLSKGLGLPLEAGRAVVKHAEPAQLDALTSKRKDLLTKYPTLAAWLSDPRNAAVGHDEIDHLAGIQDTAKDHGQGLWDSVMAGPRVASNAYAAGLHGTDAQMIALAAIKGWLPHDVAVHQGAAAVQRMRAAQAANPPSEQIQEFEQAQSEYGTYAAAVVHPWDAFHSFDAWLTDKLVGGLPSLGVLANASAAGALAGSPGGIPGVLGGAEIGLSGGFYLQGAGAKALDELSRRGVDLATPEGWEAALRDPAMVAYINSQADIHGLSSAVGMKVLMQMFPAAEVGGEGVLGKVAGHAKEIGKQAAVLEGGTLAGQALAGQPIQAKDIPAGLAQSLVTAAGFHSFGQAHAALGREGVETLSRAAQAAQDAAASKAVGEAAAESKVRMRSPERFEPLLQAYGEQAGTPTFYWQRAEWDKAMLAAEKSPADEAARITGSDEAYRESATTGTVAVPYGAVMTHLASEPEYSTLNDIARLRPDGMTAKEAPKAVKETLAQVQSLADQQNALRAEKANLEAQLAEVGGSTLFQAPTDTAGQPLDNAGQQPDRPPVDTEKIKARLAEINAALTGDERQATADTLKEQYAATFAAGGFPKAEAEHGGALLSRLLSTIAERTGLDIGDLAKRLNIRSGDVSRETPGDVTMEQGGEAGPRGQVTMQRMGDTLTATIKRMADADPSTLFHEIGHVALEVYGDIAQAKDAPEQIRADYAEALKYLGVDSREALGTEHHEKFARSFEAYLREGKAPSEGLRRIFSTLKRWLTKVYSDGSLLGVNLSPEIRGVFDRMLASDAEITQARENAGLVPAFIEKPAEMPDETWAQLQTLRQATRDAEVAALDAKQMRELEADKRVIREEQFQRIRKDVAAKVEQTPEVIAYAKLRKEGGPKIDAGSLDSLDPETRKALTKLDVTAEGGAPLDGAAEMLGFTSGDDLAKSLIAAAEKERRIDRLAKAQLDFERPELMRSKEIQRQATDLVESDTDLAVQREELKVLNVLAQGEAANRRESMTPEFPARTIRRYAEDALSGKSIRDLSNGIKGWLGNAKRAARESASAVVKGKWTEAGVAKNQDILNREMGAVAGKMLKRVEVDVRQIALRGRDTDTQMRMLTKADPAYAERMQDVLYHFGFAAKGSGSADARGDFMTWVADRAAERREPSIDPAIQADIANLSGPAKSWRDMTPDELSALRDLTDQIHTLAARQQKVTVASEEMFLDAARDRLAAAVEKSGRLRKRADNSGGALTENEQIARKWSNYGGIGRRIRSLAQQFDGPGVTNGIARKLLVYGLADAHDTENGRVLTMRRDYSALFKEFTHVEKAAFLKPMPVNGLDFSLSHADRIGIGLLMGSESGARQVDERFDGTYGVGTGARVREAVRLSFTDPRDVTLLNKLWTFNSAFWDEVVAKYQRMLGITPKKIGATPFTTPAGEATGGYHRLKYESRDGSINHDTVDTLVGMTKRGVAMRHMAQLGSTIERVNPKGLQVRIDLGVVKEAQHEVIHDLAFHEVVNDMARILSGGRVKDVIVSGHGEAAYKQFENIIEDLSAGEGRGNDASSFIMRAARQAATTALISYKIPLAFLHGPTLHGRALERWKGDYAKYVPAATARVLRDAVSMDESAVAAKTLSKMLENRYAIGTAPELKGMAAAGDLVLGRGHWYKPGKQLIDAGGRAIFGGVQQMFEIPLWWAAHDRAIDAMPTGAIDEKAAVQYADNFIRDIAGSGDMMDRSKVLRSVEAQKAFTLFLQWTQPTYDAMAERAHATDWKDTHSVAKFAASVMVLIGSAAAARVLSNHLSGNDEIGDTLVTALLGKNVGTELLGESLGEVANQFIYIRSLAGFFTGREYSGEAVGTVAHELTSHDKLTGRRAALIAGLVTGLPVPAMYNAIKGAEGLLTGTTRNPLAPLYSPPRKR